MKHTEIVEDMVTVIDDVLPLPSVSKELKQTPPDQLYQAKGVPELEENDKLSYMLHGKGTETLIRASASRSNIKIKQIRDNDAYIDFDGVRITLDEYFVTSVKSKFKLTLLTAKLLQLILIDATKLLNRDNVEDIMLSLNLSEVAEVVGRDISTKQKKSNFKREMLSTIDTLSRMSLTIMDEVVKGKPIQTGRIPLLYYYPDENNKETTNVKLISLFLEYLSECNLMTFHKDILQITDSASHQFHTEWNYRVSLPNNSQPNKSNTLPSHIISIETAIKNTKSLPTLEEVKNSDRHYTRRIIEPLEKILDDKNGIILNGKWEWRKAKGELLTEEDRNSLSDYDVIKGLYIVVKEFKDEDQLLKSARIAAGKKILKKEKVKKQRAEAEAVAKKAKPKPPKDE